ncbi:MAG TPA: sigma-70 family RNA polymerase sigma factor [Gemmataceae bacterium]|jgi:RNA polymerase sigma factor (sigma-70 family)
MSRSTLAAGVRQLRAKLACQERSEERDEQLLHDFTTQRDEAAFAVMVRRHGPMVMQVCKRVLGQEQDAEDAFQATFLVLASKAGTLRRKSALASWLYGTAYRIALKARQSAERRRKHEVQATAQPSIDPRGELLWREVRDLLDEEIARLPDKYRSVFVLCCLEELNQAEAGRRLGLKEGTVANWLSEARKRLSKSLARRGVELTAVLSAVALGTSSAPALTTQLIATTIKAASVTRAGDGLAGMGSASVIHLAQGMMVATMMSKAKTAAALLLMTVFFIGAGVWACYTLATPQISEPQKEPDKSPLVESKGRRSPAGDKNADVVVTGRVVGPDGKPAAEARVFLDPHTEDEKPIVSTTTGKDGSFSFILARSRLLDPETKFPLRRVRIVATAKGYGLDWLDVPIDDIDKEVTLRLGKDDVPIQGCILSLEGKPLAGITVRIQAVEAFPRGDLDRALDAKRKGNQIFESTEVRLLWYRHYLPDPSLMATTGADGRFRLEGVGRERIVTLNVEGPGIHYHSFNAVTRRAAAVRGPYKNDILYGATFDYIVKPARLIRGTVSEKSTGRPLAGIRMRGLGFSAYVTAEAVTDEQGRYELPGCPKENRYGVVASPFQGAPYFGASIFVPDTPGLGPLTVDLELIRGIPCEGKVLDEDGHAVAGKVRYSPLWPNPNVPDDRGVGQVHIEPGSLAVVHADGTFRCVVLPGCGCLTFQAVEPNRYQQACVDPKTIQAHGDTRFLHIQGSLASGGLLAQEDYQAIRLIKPAKDTKSISEILSVVLSPPVHGAVLDTEGKPLADVRVRGLEHGEGWKTLPNEKFNVHGVNPLRPRCLYFIQDTRRLIGSVEVNGTETKPLIMRLQPWAGVRGRLLDKEGNPLRNIKVFGSEFLAEKGQTDEQGRFRLDGLVPGLRYDLHFAEARSALSDTLRKGFVGKPGEVFDLGEMRVQPPRED